LLAILPNLLNQDWRSQPFCSSTFPCSHRTRNSRLQLSHYGTRAGKRNIKKLQISNLSKYPNSYFNKFSNWIKLSVQELHEISPTKPTFLTVLHTLWPLEISCHFTFT